MKSKFRCPSCAQILAREELPPRSKTNPQPYHQVFCENARCPSDVAKDDGGSAATEDDAYLALLNAVDHESELLAELSPIEEKDRRGWAKADHQNKLAMDGV